MRSAIRVGLGHRRDFYDFIPLGQDRMLITVGDISGKGIPAAMLLAFTRTVLRTGATRTTDPAQLLALLSNALYEDNGGTPYVTCIVAVVDARQGTVTYANAGHPPAIIAGASIRPLDGRPSGRHVRSRRQHVRHANAQSRRSDDSGDRRHQ